jgi:uncharacterized membrane protein YgaE (UPF0421/DUF939 family)
VDPQSLRGVQLAVRAAAGASIAFAVAEVLKLEHPIIAFTAAVIVTDLQPAKTRELGLRRVGATVVGAVTGAVLSPFLSPTALAVGASVLLAILISHLLRAREGAKIAGYICALIVLDDSTAPWVNGFHRMLETALGVLVGWLISYVPKLIPINEPGDERNTSQGAPTDQPSDPRAPPR